MSAGRLTQWQAEEAALRACRSRPTGTITHAEAAGRPGLDVLHDMLAGRLPASPIAESLDFLLNAGVGLVIVKMGGRGARLVGRRVDLYVPPLPAEVVDVTGAGDLFAAGFLAAMIEQAGLESAGRLALEVSMAEHDELYDDARADRLAELLRALARRIEELDRAGQLLRGAPELLKLMGDARSELFHYEVRITYDTPEVADSRRIVEEAQRQDPFTTPDEPEDDEPWRPRPTE